MWHVKRQVQTPAILAMELPGVCLLCAREQIHCPEIRPCRDFCDYPLSQNIAIFGAKYLFPCQSGHTYLKSKA